MAYSLPYIYVRGKVTQGLGRSARYLSKSGYRDQFRNKLKIDPRLGTLNLKLDDRNKKKLEDISWHGGISIEGFVENGERHGATEAFPANIRGVECAVVIPEERDSYRIMEVVANSRLRKQLNLRDGDILDVKVFIEPEESWL
ncbi:MAG: DUF120 domain-containing protein [Candidatus Aenigmatarchaeota archaeon]